MADESIKALEERLTRLEAAIAQRSGGAGGFTPPGGVIVDPAPWGGGGGWQFVPRPWPTPVVDPAPWWQGPWGPPRWPTPVVDPAPWGGGFGGGVFTGAGTSLGRIGSVGDPPPIDFSRLSASQLESTLHTINAEKARLDSMEKMVKQQLERLKQQG